MEFSNLGQYCEICNKQDFLPFEYKCCNKFYCLEHRNQHICKNIENTENKVEKKKKKKQYKCKECREKYNKILLQKCPKCEYRFCIKHFNHHDCDVFVQERRLRYYKKQHLQNYDRPCFKQGGYSFCAL